MTGFRRLALGGASLAFLVALSALTPSCHHYDDDDVECFSSGGTIVCFRDDHDHHHHITNEGTLTVALTDSPLGLRSFFLTFTELVLLSDEVKPQTIYQSRDGLRVDLLALRGTPESRLYELLARRAVTAAAYKGARLFFRAPSIVTESGGVDATAIALAAESIEITFTTPFVVGPAEDRFLVLDLDVAHSVTSPAGSSATWDVRPLVLAETLGSAEELSTPLDLEGKIVAVKDDGSFTLELEDSRGEAWISAPSPEAVILDAGIPNAGIPNAGTLEARATLASTEAISAGRRAVVRGSFRNDGSFAPGLVALGKTESFDLRVAERAGKDAVEARFESLDASGDHLVTVDWTPATEVTVGRVVQGSLNDAPAGSRVRLIGWRAGNIGDVVHGALLDLELPIQSGAERFDGIVERRFPRTRTIQLTSSNGTLRTVQLTPDAEILSLELRENVLWQSPLDFRRLTPGMKVELSLMQGGDRVQRLVVPRDDAARAR